MADAPPPERTRPVSNSLHSSLAESGGFIQEQDLQWFNDSYSGLGRVSGGAGGTEGTPHWELMARNLDANLAELDIDTFRAEDINAVLTLPPICNADFQLQESHRGEMYASVTGSMMARYDLDSSISARSSSMEEEEEESGSTDMSICRSEPLFSPMREVQPVSFSVDSLDCDGLNDQSITITCQANPYNYTIAFQGSFTTTDSESKRNASTGTPTSGASSSGVWDERPLSPTTNQRSLTQSDHPFTTWSKLKRTYELRRQGTGNNNGSSGGSSTMSTTGTGGTKSQSLPNLNKRSAIFNKPLTTVKLFDMQRSSPMRNSDMEKNVSLVKLFMQHRHSNSDDSGSDWHMHSDSGTGHSDSGTGSGYDATSPVPLDLSKVRDKSVSTVGRYTPPNVSNPFIRHVNCCNLNEGLDSLEDSLMDRGQVFRKKPVDIIFEEGTTTPPPERSSPRHTPYHHSWNNNNKASVCSYQSHSCGSSCSSNFSCASHGQCIMASRDGQPSKKKSLCLKYAKAASTQVPVHVISKCVQTSSLEDSSCADCTVFDSYKMAFSNVHNSPLKEIKPTHVAQDKRKAVYVCYPNYSLPDLTFLRKPEHLDVNYYLVPQKLRPRTSTPSSKSGQDGNGRDRPYSCDDIEAIKNSSMSHIKDWESLQTLLPPEVKEILGDISGNQTNGSEHCCRTRHRYAAPDNILPSRPHSCDCAHARSPLNFGSDNSINSCQKSSGYKGSSTLLTDSCGPVSPCHGQPEYVYQYESDSENEEVTSSYSRKLSKEGVETLRKFASERCMTPRPPLPKGILRKDSCKVHKRFSMQEFRTTVRHERLHKRRSLQDSYEQLSQKIARSLSRESCRVGAAARSRSADSQTATDSMAEQMDVIDAGSGIFGSLGNRRRGRISRREVNKPQREEPQQAWTPETEHNQQGPLECSSHSYPVFGAESDSAEGEEQDVSTHREQVSALLSSKGRLDKLASLLGVVNPYGELTSLLNSGGFRSIDNVSGNCECHCTCGEALKAKKTVSFAEKVSVKNGDGGASPRMQESKDDSHVCHCPHHNPPELRHSQSAPVVCHLSPDSSPVAFDYSQKTALVDGVRKAVDRILYQLAGRDACSLDGSINSEAAQLAFDHLCPSLYTLLSDGLNSTITGLFGTVRNSVWKVIESSSQLGPSTKALGDLVLRINSEEQLPEGPMKFNAFIAGLLNIQSLSSWLAYLRTRETVIQKHYSQSGFLYLCNTSMRERFDELLISLNSLGAIKWRLDLLFEYKRLHQSLQLMEQRLIQHGSLHEATSPKDTSPLRNSGDSPPSRPSSSLKGYPDELRYLLSPKECLSGESAPRATPEQRRPRSLVEHTGNSGFSLQELATNVKKRWSGIHFGSKLISALDRLILEDIPSRSESEDYTDSIENPHCREMRNRADSNSTMEDLPYDGTDDNKNSQTVSPQTSKGAKFRHLQRKWELISGSGSGSGVSVVSTPAPPVQPRSRLPRPVTSPTRPLRAFRLHTDKKETSKSAKPPVPEKTKETLKRPPMKINLKSREGEKEKVKTKLTPEADKSPLDGDKVEKSPSPMSLSSSSGRSSGSSKCSPQSSTMVGAKRPLIKGLCTPPSSPRKTFIPRAPRKVATGRQDTEQLKRTPVHTRKETIRPTSPLTDDNANSTQAELRERKKIESKTPEKKARKLQTLHHHLATQSGHLSFTRGQELTLILEVDDDWLLCCQGNQRGLVPRRAVIQRH